MRPRLLHPLAERRDARRPSRRRGARKPVARAAEAALQPARDSERPVDTAVQRVREAGGPIDRASYSCHCGYLFEAKVSTTVSCPHCGAAQAW
jgi:rubrerythrin